MTVAVIDSLSACWQHVVPYVEGAWARFWPGGVCAYTTAAIPTMNGVWSAETQPDLDRLDAALADVAATGAPYCLQLPVSGEPLVGDLLRRHGLTFAGDSPLMLLPTPADLVPPQHPAGLVLRTLPAEQFSLHAQVAAAGFEAPPQIFELLRKPAAYGTGVRSYVGEFDGTPVVTGLGIVVDGRVGVFNIATLAAYRGRGYGAALTAHVLTDAFARGASTTSDASGAGASAAGASAAGATSAWLQSSDAGFGVYRRLGFRVVDTWRCWITGQ